MKANSSVGLSFAGLLLSASASVAAPVEQSWIRTYGPADPKGIFLDGQSNVVALGSEQAGFLRIEYGSDGTQLKLDRYPSLNETGFNGAITDQAGNFWIAGTVPPSDPMAPPATVIIKYGPSGERMWLRRVEDAYFSANGASGLTLDPSGNLYVAATVLTSAAPAVQSQYRVAKYSSEGEELWVRSYPAKPGRFAYIAKIALDTKGNVVVAGYTYGAGGISEFMTVKYDSSGNFRWAAQNDWEATSCSATAMAVDRQGNVYVTGNSYRGRDEFRTAKYGPEGTLLWTVARPAERYNVAWARDLGVDKAGNLFITGFEELPLPSKWDDPNPVDCVTVKYDPSGAELWSARLPEATPNSLKIGADDNIYVAATGEDLSTGTVVAYNSSGNQLWKLNGSRKWFGALEADAAGSVFVVGRDSFKSEMETRKLTPGLISSLPEAQIVPPNAGGVEGEAITFTAIVSGTGPFAFQWNYFGFPLVGETTATLTLKPVRQGQRGGYTVRVTSQGGETISPEAHLVVRLPPTIVSIAETNTVAEGRRGLRFTASAIGDLPLFYQWQFDGAPLPGATNKSLELGPVSTSQAGRYTLVVTNDYGMHTSDPYILSVVPRSPLDEWQWRHPNPQGNDLTGAAFGQGRYVVVGRRGTLMTSLNAVDWTNQSDERFGDLNEVIFNQGQFVTAGATGQLFTSSNGLDWAERGPDSAVGYDGLAFGNGLFVAIGGEVYLTSKDGENWLSHPWPVRGFIATDIAFGASRFVAIGNGQTLPGLTSTDGISWAPVQIVSSNVGTTFRITYGNGLFLAANLGQSFVSNDGLTWTSGISDAARMFTGIAGGNGAFVAVGTSGVGGDAERTRLFTSLDGLTWATNSLAIANNLLRVVFVGGRFLALGDDGNLFSSATGTDWTAICPSTDVNLRAVAEGAGKHVAVGAGGRILISHDGGRWLRKEAGITATLVDVAYGAGSFAALENGGHVYLTSDGSAWTRIDATTNHLSGIVFANGLFAAVGDGGTIVTSPNGANWTSRPLGTTEELVSVIYGGGRFVVAGPNTIVTSTDGVTWISQKFDLRGGTKLAYGNGLYLLIGAESATVSSDTVTWATKPFPGTRPVPNSIAFGAGIFVAVGSNGTLFSSTNGLDWVEHYTPCQNHLRKIIYTSHATFLVVANNESILQSAPLLPHLQAARTDSDAVELEVTGWKGQSYRIQATTRLPSKDWQEVASFILSETTTNFVEPGNSLQRFYRVVSP